MSFAETLARLRDAANLTQVELAQKANVPIDTLRRWEQGRHLPRIDDAYRLAKALGVGIEKVIIGRDMEEAPPPSRRAHEPKKPRKGKGAK